MPPGGKDLFITFSAQVGLFTMGNNTATGTATTTSLFGAPEERSIEWAQKPELMKRMKEEAKQPRPETKR